MLGIVSRLRLHGVVLTVATDYVGVLAAAILLIATNAGLIGISRLSWSLAEHRQLPGLFCGLHPRFRTPWFTIVVFSVFAVFLLIPGKTELLGNLYSFGAMLSFTTAHVAIIALRIKQPDRERPYRIGATSASAGAIPISRGDRRARHVRRLGLRRRAARRGALSACLDGVRARSATSIYRRSQGSTHAAQHRIERPQRPADFPELGYRTALVAIFGADVSATTLVSAAKLIGRGHRLCGLRTAGPAPALARRRPLAEEAHGRSILEGARIQGRRAGIKVRTGLIRARNPGAALVDEAERIGADVIYLSEVHAPASEQGIGLTALPARPTALPDRDRDRHHRGTRRWRAPDPLTTAIRSTA